MKPLPCVAALLLNRGHALLLTRALAALLLARYTCVETVHRACSEPVDGPPAKPRDLRDLAALFQTRAFAAPLLTCALAALLLTHTLAAQPDPAVLLQSARARILAETAALARYTCVETVHRARFEPLHGPPAKRCDLLGRTLQTFTDRLRLDVTVSEGAEIFSWAGARRFSAADSREFAAGGLAATGDFGRFLVAIFGESADIRFTAWEGSTAIYRYRVPLAASRYEITLDSRSLPMAYEGAIRLDARTADLTRLTIEVPAPPRAAQTCRIETRIDYTRAQIGAATLSLPQLTQLKLWDAEGARWENRTTFSACRAFASESTFRTAPTPTAAAPAAASTTIPAPPAALPPGLTLQIELLTAISEDSAFAGDPVEARLARPLRTAEGRVLAPQGTPVHGRIVRAERHLAPSRYFALGLKFDSLTLDGAELPLSLEFVPRSRPKQLAGGTFVYPEDHAEIAPGLLSEWKTRSR